MSRGISHQPTFLKHPRLSAISSSTATPPTRKGAKISAWLHTKSSRHLQDQQRGEEIVRRLADTDADIQSSLREERELRSEVPINKNESEVMMAGSVDTSGPEDVGVGMAYTTNEQIGSSSPAFNTQYLQQQQAYAQQEERRLQQQQQRKLQRPAGLQERTSSTQSVGTSASSSRRPSAASSPLHSQSTTSLQAPESLIPAQNRVFAAKPNISATNVGKQSVPSISRNGSRRRPSQESTSSFSEVQSSSATLLNQFNSSGASASASASAGSRGNGDHQQKSDNGDPGAQFSVEVIAPAFDQRGYPVFSGRAARIRGVLRTRVVKGCEVIVRLTAAIAQGSPAAVWDGLALMSPDAEHEGKVFDLKERIVLTDNMISLKPGVDPSQATPDDYIYTIPFDVNLPLGFATKDVNGVPTRVAVALPPSYELSTETNAKERESIKANKQKSSAASIKSKSSRMTNFSQNMGGIGTSLKEAVEKGFEEEFRIGCFYNMGFTLQSVAEESVVSAEKPKKKLGKKKKEKVQHTVIDKISVPFIFTGEPTSLPPPPHSIPLSLLPSVLHNPGRNLGPEWECEVNKAKWSGNMFTTLKERNVDLEMHMPSPAVLQAPSVFPIILIIRPQDPSLLSSIPTMTEVTSPTLESDGFSRARSSRSAKSSTSAGNHQYEKEVLRSSEADQLNTDGMLSKFMRNSFSIGRKSSSSNISSSRNSSTLSPSGSHATFDSASRQQYRPNTASSVGGSSETPSANETVTGPGARYNGNLSGLVRISLLQTTHCTSSGPSEEPKHRRRLISEAELEEVDVFSICDAVRQTNGHSLGGTDASDEALYNHVQAKGIRIIKGLIRVGTDTVPSFRCQGIEVKYALKVDLIPFSKTKDRKRPNSSGSQASNATLLADTASVKGRRPSLMGRSSSPSIHGITSPPVPSFPPEHRRSQQSISSSTNNPNSAANIASSPSHRSHIEQQQRFQGFSRSQPKYTPSVVLGLGGMGTSTVVSESAVNNTRPEKGVGALWADVRMVRSAFAA